jgi:hypothetical protein
MPEKARYNVYLETSTVEDAKELDDFDSFSECVETLVSAYLAGEIALSETGTQAVHNDGTQGSELDALQERMDEFEQRAQVAFDERDERLDSLRRDVEELRDLVSHLEDVARE